MSINVCLEGVVASGACLVLGDTWCNIRRTDSMCCILKIVFEFVGRWCSEATAILLWCGYASDNMAGRNGSQRQIIHWNTCRKTAQPKSKAHGDNMGPIWGRQDPGGPHVGSMNFSIWECSNPQVQILLSNGDQQMKWCSVHHDEVVWQT